MSQEPKLTKIGLEIQDFFQKNGSGVSGAEKGLEKVGLHSPELKSGLKKGGLEGGTSPYHLSL